MTGTNRLLLLPIGVRAMNLSISLLAKKAVNMLSSTPIASVSAKPCIMLVLNLSPNQNSTTAVMMVDMFPSRIDGHARSKPAFNAANRSLPARSSSLARSDISMFASTANPSESITAAAPDSVRVTGMSLNIPSNITVYAISEMLATIPGSL